MHRAGLLDECLDAALHLLDLDVVHLAEDVELHLAAGDGGGDAHGGECHGGTAVLRHGGLGGSRGRLGALADAAICELSKIG